MRFSATLRLGEQLRNRLTFDDAVLEQRAMEATQGVNSVKLLGVDDEPMHIRLITDSIIEDNHLPKISNPIMFERGDAQPTPDGLYSKVIFGPTQEDEMRQYAYIDLKRTFFHPYVFEILCKVLPAAKRIAAGESAWTITPSGEVVEVKKRDDPAYDEDNTGLAWLIDNYKKIKLARNKSRQRDERLTFLAGLDDEEIFISKWIVIPVFYRPLDMSSGRPSVPKLNYEYNTLIRYANSLSGVGLSILSSQNNQALFNIQNTMVNIRQYGQRKVGGKKGALHSSVLGKSISWGSRDVISAPIMANCDRPEDSLVDYAHGGFPLSKCLVLGYPFIIKWVMEFFEKEFGDQQKYPVVTGYEKNGTPIIEDRDIQDISMVYSQDKIKKKMKEYMHTFSGRFDPVMIKFKDGKELPIAFTGRGYSRASNQAGSATISKRAMTWTDIFYMAAASTLEDKYVWVTRYPVSDYLGMFPVQCRVMSTIKTMPMIVGDQVYPFYPVIDPATPREKIALRFIDTVTFSNLMLKSTGGDYDGDTISDRMVYSLEANREAQNIMSNPKYFLSIAGKLIRELSNESILTFYSMTKD